MSWRTCTLSSDFYPLSVGTGPKGGSLSSHLLLTRWLSAVGLLLTQQVYGGQGPLVSAFQTARPCSGSSWGLPGSLTLHPGLIPSKLPARVDLTAQDHIRSSVLPILQWLPTAIRIKSNSQQYLSDPTQSCSTFSSYLSSFLPLETSFLIIRHNDFLFIYFFNFILFLNFT